jgi:hypothetical protein
VSAGIWRRHFSIARLALDIRKLVYDAQTQVLVKQQVE